MTRPRPLLAVCIAVGALAAGRAVAAPAPGAASPTGRHCLWQVQSPTGASRAYLLGSIHMLDRRIFPLAPTIEDAFDASQGLVLEANVFGQDPNSLGAAVLTHALYTDGQTLSTALPEGDYQHAAQRLEQLGLDIAMLEMFRPWFVALTAAQMGLMRIGCRPEYGIDHYFYTRATEANKPILELESAEFQIQLMAGLPPRDQALLLTYTLNDIDQLSYSFDRMVTAWQRGDIATVTGLVRQSMRSNPRFATIQRVLLDDRNRGMVSRIAGLMQSGRQYFVVVGAAHLVGDTGIVTLLQRQGYHVQQL